MKIIKDKEETTYPSPKVVSIVQLPNNPEHALSEVFKSRPLTYKLVGMVGIPGTNTYCSVVATVVGDKVTLLEAGTPNLRKIAESEAKIEFVNVFMADEIPGE